MSSVKKSFPVVILVVGVVLGATVGIAVGGQQVRATVNDNLSDAKIVVDDDGDADYRSIQAAVDAATSGDTVEVRPGTYEEQIVVDEAITLVAPQDATLDGSAIEGESRGITIPAGSDVEPVIDGFEITGYFDAVVASDTTGDWTIRNTTISDNGNDGVVATETAGAWTIANSTLARNGDEGLDAENTTGPWTIQNTTIVESGDDAVDVDGSEASAAWTIQDSVLRQPADDGIDADDSTGAWTIRRTTISETWAAVQAINTTGDWSITGSILRNSSAYGVSAFQSTGDWTINGSHVRFHEVAGVEASETTGSWTIRGTTIHDASVAVHAGSSTGDWTIRESSIRNTSVPEFELTGEGTGVFASNTTGTWKVHDSNVVGHTEHALDATGASPSGDATGNWWGSESGPADSECIGSVDCDDASTAPVDVQEPPTVPPGYYSQKATTDEGGIGIISIGIIVSLALIVVVLGVLSWRIR